MAADLNETALLALPWAPGEAPFRIKGIAYRGHLEYVRRHVPGGHDAVMDELGDPALTEFFANPFLPSSRFDIFPLAIAGIGCARLTGHSFLEFVRIRSTWQAKTDMRGMYSWLVRLATPKLIAGHLPRLVVQYLDFGRTSAVLTGTRCIKGSFMGMPRPLAPWFLTATTPYFELLLQLAGATKVVVRPLPLQPTRVEAGVQLVTSTFEVEWEIT